MPPKDTNYGVTDFYEVGIWSQYAICFYYAIILLLGGEIEPMELDQTVVASFVVIVGQIATTFIFGSIAALMAAMNLKDNQYQEQFDMISNLMRAIQLPVPIQEEVEAYILHIQQIPGMQQDMRVFLKLLSPSLRSQILFHMYKQIVKKISIFDSCSNTEIRYLVNKMRTVIFLPNDDIIRQGDNGKRLYFINRGTVEVWIGPDGQTDSFQRRNANLVEKTESQ